ncbi:hypothetical protein [Vibrio splendidus]|uniref:hypothetical protein n=1 Tax=Vibrio splendidus TaxID=29497 RepID=UPI000C82D01C|nr:hypothetical protein [Vibrio splendidus]PMO52547.1 hypothetical protein BCT08_21390 [Vibrio splendidus]
MIGLITGLLGIGKAVMQNKAEDIKEKNLLKREQVQSKREANQQKAQSLSQGEQSMASLDAITLKQIGWLDDFVVIVTMLSILLNFIPTTSSYMSSGFAALDSAPQWYQYAVGAVYVYVLGFKSLIYRLLVRRGV